MPALSPVCQHYPQGSSPKARAAGKDVCAPQLCLTKHLTIDISSSLDSVAAPGEAPILLKAGAVEGAILVLKN